MMMQLKSLDASRPEASEPQMLALKVTSKPEVAVNTTGHSGAEPRSCILRNRHSTISSAFSLVIRSALISAS